MIVLFVLHLLEGKRLFHIDVYDPRSRFVLDGQDAAKPFGILLVPTQAIYATTNKATKCRAAEMSINGRFYFNGNFVDLPTVPSFSYNINRPWTNPKTFFQVSQFYSIYS